MDPQAPEVIEVSTCADLKAHGSAAARTLAAEAEAQGRTLSVLAAPVESLKIMAKRRHDVRAAMRTLGFTVEALKGGYTFQDESAKAKIEAIAKAVNVLEKEAALWVRAMPE